MIALHTTKFKLAVFWVVIVIGCFSSLDLGYANEFCGDMNRDKTHNVYRLPFASRWLVLWGGCKEEDNIHHYKVAVQRYAYDLVKVDDKGKYFKGNGKKLSDYYSYGEIVYAPMDGKIVAVVNGIDDSLTPNPYFIPGNLIVIKHKGNEYSYIAHLQKNSIQVTVGQYVTRGQPIAKCGSSGNATMPHVHYHVSNGARFQDGKGLAIEFSGLQLNGAAKELAMPVKGNIVENN